MTLQITSVRELQDAVREHVRVHVRGGGSKPALSTPPEDAVLLDISGLSGVLEYEPEEFTFTAKAGTPVLQVQAMLAEQGQYLPFDPPLADAGATLGGVVAAGTNGPARYRYGGVRDFLIGIRFVDGRGELVRGGGKVVKNAAGFDFPKLFVGSLGRLGAISEVTFKVFPEPVAYGSLRVELPDLDHLLPLLFKLTGSHFDIHALDFDPAESGWRLWVRLGGLEPTLAPRLKALQSFLEAGEVIAGEDEPLHWAALTRFAWQPDGAALVKSPVTPKRIPVLDAALAKAGAHRRYSVGGNLAWIAWPGDLTLLDQLLRAYELNGLVLRGDVGSIGPWLGKLSGGLFARRVKGVLDPEGKFGPI